MKTEGRIGMAANRRCPHGGRLCCSRGVARAPQAAPEKYPPQFPREGATKLFENDRIIVWEQVGRPKNAFVHRHVRDTIVFGLEPGRVSRRP
jgi:hypothetical protein